jgi:hypothetical protein
MIGIRRVGRRKISTTEFVFVESNALLPNAEYFNAGVFVFKF